MTFKESYLATYNGVQLMGWAYILSLYISESIFRSNWLNPSAQVDVLLRLFQSLAIVEVIHASIGLVRSSVITTLIQISSRLFIVWGIVYLLPEVTRENFGVPLIIISWSIAEMVRYAYYMADICGAKFRLLTWIRYSAFMVLYPTGISGEILLVLGGIKSLKETGKYSVNLPNALNCSFSYLVVLVVALIIYVPGSKTMYTHMLRQRKKILWKKD